MNKNSDWVAPWVLKIFLLPDSWLRAFDFFMAFVSLIVFFGVYLNNGLDTTAWIWIFSFVFCFLLWVTNGTVRIMKAWRSAFPKWMFWVALHFGS